MYYVIKLRKNQGNRKVSKKPPLLTEWLSDDIKLIDTIISFFHNKKGFLMEKTVQFNGSKDSSAAFLFVYFTSVINAQELLTFIQNEGDYIGIGATIKLKIAGWGTKRALELKNINNTLCLKGIYYYDSNTLYKDKQFRGVVEDKDSVVNQISNLIEFFERSRKIKN